MGESDLGHAEGAFFVHVIFIEGVNAQQFYAKACSYFFDSCLNNSNGLLKELFPHFIISLLLGSSGFAAKGYISTTEILGDYLTLLEFSTSRIPLKQ